MAVSVVIPTHDRDRQLQVAVRSVLAQTVAPAEVVVVDDLSSAATEACVEQIGRENAIPVSYLANDRCRGPSTSRNLGAAATSGDVIATLDDDDHWRSRYLAATLEVLEGAPADVVLAGRLFVADDGTLSPGTVPPGDFQLQRWLLHNPGAVASNMLVRRAAFDAVGGYDERLNGAEDRDLLLRLVLAGFRYAACGERLVCCSQSIDDRVTAVVTRAWVANQLRFYGKHWRLYEARNHVRQWYKLARLTVAAVRRLPP